MSLYDGSREMSGRQRRESLFEFLKDVEGFEGKGVLTLVAEDGRKLSLRSQSNSDFFINLLRQRVKELLCESL